MWILSDHDNDVYLFLEGKWHILEFKKNCKQIQIRQKKMHIVCIFTFRENKSITKWLKMNVKF